VARVRRLTAAQLVGPAPVGANDQIIAVPAMMNFDEASFPDPLKVVRTPPPHHRHIRPWSAYMRRRQYRARAAEHLIEEWLARIPDFQVSRKTPPMFEPGVTVSYDRLMLEWPVGHA
jgi:hypothetical protein